MAILSFVFLVDDQKWLYNFSKFCSKFCYTGLGVVLEAWEINISVNSQMMDWAELYKLLFPVLHTWLLAH